jgi:Carboxylesterase family
MSTGWSSFEVPLRSLSASYMGDRIKWDRDIIWILLNCPGAYFLEKKFSATRSCIPLLPLVESWFLLRARLTVISDQLGLQAIVACNLFAAGSNYFDGTAYASLHNVVFVSFNYRVGAFGIIAFYLICNY